MKPVFITIAAVVLTGCAAPRYIDASGQDMPSRIYEECDFEATKATAGIVNGVQAGWMQAEIRGKCIRLRGYNRTQKGA